MSERRGASSHRHHIFYLIPHTHWDREWYLTAPVFRARLVATLDDLLARFAAEPTLRGFLLDGQTVHVEDYLRMRPEREAAVRELVQAGRLHVGPWYVLADEQIPSGESLVRNLLLGRADAARLGGRLDVLYSPDAFGHPPAWPTLAAEFGIRFGVLWRGYGGEPGQERDLFRWRGRDGREVVVYHLPPDGYEVGAALPTDLARLRTRWPAVRDALTSRAAGPHVAVFVGADHHALHADLPRVRDLLAELEPGATVRIAALDEYLAAAAGTARDVPEVRGELRWSYGYTWTLQGTHGTRLPLKRLYGESELALERVAEPLAALALRHRDTDARPTLTHAWRTLVRSQFHDSLCGCTSDAVARAVEVRLESARALAHELARDGLYRLIGHDTDLVRDRPAEAMPRLVLWNGAARARGGVLVLDTTWFTADVLVGSQAGRTVRRGEPPRAIVLRLGGRTLPVQLLGRAHGQERLDAARHYPDQDEVERIRLAVAVPEVDGFGVAELVPDTTAEGDGVAHVVDAVAVRGRRLVNERIEVGLGDDGALELCDRRNGQRLRGQFQFECDGDAGDTYSYSPARSARERTGRPDRVRVLARGPLVAALEARWSLGAAAVRMVVSLHAGEAVARCSLDVDSFGRDYRLRARVPSGLPGVPALAGAAFGAVTREAVVVDRAAYPRETPVATAPAHRFVAVTDTRHGVAVFAPGFMEYELEPSGDLSITLLRAVGQLSRGDLPTRPGNAGWPEPTPLAQCVGRHRMQFGVAPLHAGEGREDQLAAAWEDLFAPIRAVWLRQSLPLTLPDTSVTLEGDGLVFSAMKPAEAGHAIILRCVNARDEPVTGAWRLATPARAAARLRADEQESEPLPLAAEGRVVPIHAGPRQLVTVRID